MITKRSIGRWLHEQIFAVDYSSSIALLRRLSRRDHQRQDEEKSDRRDKTAWALSLGLVGAGFAFSTQALLAEEAKTRKVEKVEEKRKGKSQVEKLVF